MKKFFVGARVALPVAAAIAFAAVVLFAGGAAWAQSGAKGTQGNPYDWSSMALQPQNADIPAGAYIKTASGKIRPVTADEID